MLVKKGNWLIIAFILLAFGLRAYQLGTPSLWYDELLELDLAQSDFWQIGPQLEQHAAMPLDYYLLHGWLTLGRQEYWVRLPALFFGVLAVPLMFRLANALFNRRVGYLAALLLASASFAVHYSQETRPYALLFLLTLVTFLGLWRVYRTGQTRYWLVVCLGLTGAALTHYFSLFLLAPLGLFVGWQQLTHLRQKKFWRHTACFGLILLALLVVFALNGRLGLLYSVGGRFSTLISQPASLVAPSREKPNKGLGPPIEPKFLITGIMTPLASTNPVSLLGYTGLLGLTLFTAIRSKNRAALFLLLGWLVIPITLIYLFLLQRGTFFATRYIFYTLPAYLGLVAYGLDTLTTRLARLGPTLPARRLALTGLLTALLTGLMFGEGQDWLSRNRAESYEDWRAVGQLLRDNARPDDAVMAVRAEPAINWYYPPARAAYRTFTRSEAIWQAIKQHPRRWFVLSSYSTKQDQNLRDWLNENGAVAIAIDRRVVVYVQQQGLTTAQLLAQVSRYRLPSRAQTYATLADQLRAQGDLQTSRAFYQKAIALAADPAEKAEYEARLMTLAMLP